MELREVEALGTLHTTTIIAIITIICNMDGWTKSEKQKSGVIQIDGAAQTATEEGGVRKGRNTEEGERRESIVSEMI